MDIVRTVEKSVKDVPDNVIPAGMSIIGLVGSTTFNVGKYATSLTPINQMYLDVGAKFVIGGALFTQRDTLIRALGLGIMMGALIRLAIHLAILKPEQLPR